MLKMCFIVRLINQKDKERLFQIYESRLHYTCKADVYGCCIKLLTDSESIKNELEDNFCSANENTCSHGRLVVLKEPDQPLSVKYDPYTKTAFLINVDSYGWIKSITLSVAGDLLEDDHKINSVHGASIDVDGIGVSIIAPSGTGKTTHSWGLLLSKNARLISDDWFFFRLSNRTPLGIGSEKNCYIDSDLGKIWNAYEGLIDKTRFDLSGRAVVNVRWIVGGGLIPMTTIQKIILLKRDAQDTTIVKHCTTDEALEFMIEKNFCNPRQLVRDARKMELRKDFFRRFFEQTDVYLVNTTGTPQSTREEIRRIVSEKKSIYIEKNNKAKQSN
jgi:hypothetical protein